LVHGDAYAVPYASSAATYGDGARGFDDEWSPAALQRLSHDESVQFSEHLFDLAIVDRFARRETPPQWAGHEVLQRVQPERVPQGVK
jgi:ADP-L-glycero-D-manno-heptose 6-epimerase